VAAIAALVLAVGPLLPVAALAAEPVAAEPDVVFEVMTTAVGLSLSSTQRPAASVVTGGLVDSSTGYSSSAVSSAGASASASAAFYPGDLVATGPALLCSEFLPCPVEPPTYPRRAQASWPERPSATADSPAPAGTARASARELTTEGATELSRVAPSGTPVVVSVGAQQTSTRSWADTAGGHVRSSSTLHDVVVGPLRIAVLTALDAVDVAPSGRVSDHPRVELAGVTFAGLAASVDSDGVHVLGVGQSLPDRQLAENGVTIRALGASRTDGTGAARSTAGGLQVTFSVPVQGVPPIVPGLPSADRSYLGSLTIGGVGAAVAVGAPGAPLLDALPVPPPSSLAARLFPPAAPGRPSTSASGPHVVSVDQPAVVVPLAGGRRSTLPQPDLTVVALVLAVVPTSALLAWRLVAMRRMR
jgi:hypothetical protein